MATAVAELMREAAPGADGGQDELFEPDVPMAVQPIARSGPKGGRPAGARNKSTEEWRAYLLARYRSPLVGLLEIASRSPRELAQQIGLYEYFQDVDGDVRQRLAVVDAFKIQVDALKAALPYLHQRQPLAIEGKGNTRGLLVIGDMTVNIGAEGNPLGLAPDEQNQRVIDAHAVQSDGAQSDNDK